MSEKLIDPGPEGWRGMDAAGLARQYNARGTVPDVASILKDYQDASATMYQLPHVRDIAYGTHPDERLDLFPVPGKPDAPLFVFIHGGYWRALGKEDSVFMAKTFTQRGIAVASINYQLSPAASLEEIVSQCRRAIAWLYKNAAREGVDPTRMVLSGSSAGAHLAAMVMAPGWQAEAGMPDGHHSVIRGGVLVSGLFDLAPVQQTTPNEWLQLDAQRAKALSPIHLLPPSTTRLCIATAELDTDEFKRQSVAYAAACSQYGCEVQYLEVAGRNHFDIILDWMNPEALLTRRTLQLFATAGILS
ncbi:MAG: alpha/beta hydrolase [Pseudomonadota bacterium]